MVKEELNTEEQFFEKAVQTERFVKKYKSPLIAVTVAVILTVATSASYSIYQENKRTEANLAFNVVMQNPSDTATAQNLKSLNPKLYDLFVLSTALKSKDQEALRTLSSSKALVVSDLASYELAALQEDKQALQSYAQKNGALLKELAVIEEAVIMMKEGEADRANAQLKMIDVNSPLYALAQSLAHYGVK